MFDLGIVKTNKEEPISSDEIKDNIDELKGKLKRNTSPLYQHLYSSVDNMNISNLSWKDPLASQVVSDKSELVKTLPRTLKKGFMVRFSLYFLGS